ncbi:hypothetical protein WI44_13890 [Burkholderia cepacia]|nr:hypothetical protein WI45_28855 [Burkholderia cepacia]KVA35142.1 hypothetical protein WI44_13890 [Burkholderia cepacia]KVH60690.1 hypothetical protein WJ40_20905 [Burkholderia cepacia]
MYASLYALDNILKLDLIARLTLPNHENFPSEIAQRIDGFGVAVYVSFELLLPIIYIASW